MKPPFALSLSFDGIRLLHRAAGGWRVVGDVALDAADMGAELDGLRAKAKALEPGGVFSKLLLPNEQIKYLTIPTPDMDDAARRAATVAALDGATPYAVDDLAFDICVEGDSTHIAAVAIETLAEAEAFALEHNFQPVSFAGIPGDAAFLGEPSFGPTASADGLLPQGETAEPDGIAVVVIGAVEMPADDAPISEPELDAVTASEPDPALVPETPAVPDIPETAELAAPEAQDISAPEAPEGEPVQPTIVSAPLAPEPPKAAPVLAVDTIKAAPPEPVIGFASRRAAEKNAPPALGGANRGAIPPAPQLGALDAGVTSGQIPVEPDEVEPVPPAPVPVPASSDPYVAQQDQRQSDATAVAAGAPGSEQQRMTVFGARQAGVGGKPRFLGLILTTALLVFLAGVAAWASIFLDKGINLSRFFGDRAPEIAQTEVPDLTLSAGESASITVPRVENTAPLVQMAALDPTLTPEDNAVLDALSEPEIAEPQPVVDTSVEAKYAADGIWSRAPVVPDVPISLVGINNLYLASIDPVSTASDAIALPPTSGYETDTVLAAVPSPPAPGTLFALDEQGRVVPTVEGAISPDGFTVFLGPPPLIPPNAGVAVAVPKVEAPVIDAAVAAVRPLRRPGDLVERAERAQLDGLTRSELAGYRPSVRPASVQQQALAATIPEPEPVDTDAAVAAALTPPDPEASATRLAAAASLRPDPRPRNFARQVGRAQRTAPQQESRVASAAAVAPRTVTPNIPSKTSVAKAATTRNAINLRNVNLIGVYGKPANRRALVRLSNGRYKKVVVGDRIDGGVVAAIGEAELRYRANGRDKVLKMPK